MKRVVEEEDLRYAALGQVATYAAFLSQAAQKNLDVPEKTQYVKPEVFKEIVRQEAQKLQLGEDCEIRLAQEVLKRIEREPHQLRMTPEQYVKLTNSMGLELVNAKMAAQPKKMNEVAVGWKDQVGKAFKQWAVCRTKAKEAECENSKVI